ncbi:MAG: hypothetical protein J6D06_04790 [Clostridia bacterium]|nr:hypothetical protein [Clostridia bacterium]
MKFIVTIEETVSQDFEIEAENREEVFEIMRKKYRNCECVLEPGNLIGTKMLISKVFEDNSEWIEFK